MGAAVAPVQPGKDVFMLNNSDFSKILQQLNDGQNPSQPDREDTTLTENQIREIVKMTLEELEKRGKIKNPYNRIRKEVERSLELYFSGKDETCISGCLEQMADDPYIGIIYAQYKDHQTMEKTAELLGKDVSTIKRNKRRLILDIYGRMN